MLARLALEMPRTHVVGSVLGTTLMKIQLRDRTVASCLCSGEAASAAPSLAVRSPSYFVRWRCFRKTASAADLYRLGHRTNLPAYHRVLNTFRVCDIQVDEAFFMGGVSKAGILAAFQPHIFF